MMKSEILAPAGGMDSLISAVNCGADAVYMGWEKLNARRGAQNFTQESFLIGAAYCKTRGVRVYMTLNTTVYDREQNIILQALELACKAGVDGIIVQDMGVARLAKACCPDLPLHASTQMTIHNLSGAKALVQLGYRRAVLARELSKNEIASITHHGGIPTEVFVHGALCVCVSGQCYMSAMIGQRSGNRGLCAGPCRLPFSSREDQSEYALSLKDLSLVDKLKELSAIGVESFKIEGRMKRPEYVAAAVTACRDSIAGREVDRDGLKKIFSRSGFTDGYYTNTAGQKLFGVRRKEDAKAAGEVLGQFAAQAEKEYPRIAVHFYLELEPDKPARLIVEDGQHRIEVNGEIPQIARNKPTTYESAEKSLSKLGGTFYIFGSLKCRISPDIMLPASALNSMRREAITKLTAEREKLSPIAFQYKRLSAAEEILAPQRPAWRVSCSSIRQVSQEMIEQCEWIELPIKECLKAEPDVCGKLIAQLPHVCFGDDKAKLSQQLEQLNKKGIHHLSACHLGGLYLGRESGFILHGDYGLNITNSLALQEYAEYGLKDAVLSYELNLAQAKDIRKIIPSGIIAYGYLPLMVMRCCPFGNDCSHCNRHRSLTDRKGTRFQVACFGEYRELYNSAPLYLADKINDLHGLHFIKLMFTTESPETCRKIFSEYRLGKASDGKITRGLYYRKVL